MSGILLPRPENLRVPHGPRSHMVESDVYHICERLKEIDPNLYLYALDPPIPMAGKVYAWSVNEFCADRVERLVMRFEELDARIIENIEYLLHVPFEQRLKIAERIEEEHQKEATQKELDELYERMGGPMWTQLEHDGFIQRSVSYRKIPRRRHR